jgi:hypothetical protein
LKGWEAIGGPTAAYPDIKAKVVGKVFDAGGVIYYDNSSNEYRWPGK